MLSAVEEVDIESKSDAVFSSSVDLAIKTVWKTMKSATQDSEGSVGVRVASCTCLGPVHSIFRTLANAAQ